jgi:ubiquinone/menaquinone biosynthesis C-methylase UbiE
VLDVGCGPGVLSCLLAGRVAHLVALDTGVGSGWRRLEQTRQLARSGAGLCGGSRVSVVAASVYALPFPDGCFDVVHAHQLLQHLGGGGLGGGPLAALREMRRVCKPGAWYQ